MGKDEIELHYVAASCPFCGTTDEPPHEHVLHEFGDDEGSAVQVKCSGCGAFGPIVRGPMIGDCTNEQCAQAVALWNGRPAVVGETFVPCTGAEFVAGAQAAIEPRSDEEIREIIEDIERR